MATMTEVLGKVAEVAAGVNALEAQITEILANAGVPAEVQAQIDEAFAQLSTIVSDAADGVDEAVPTPAP